MASILRTPDLLERAASRGIVVTPLTIGGDPRLAESMSDRTRRRLGDLFWHSLTGLAFAAVVLLMFIPPVP